MKCLCAAMYGVAACVHAQPVPLCIRPPTCKLGSTAGHTSCIAWCTCGVYAGGVSTAVSCCTAVSGVPLVQVGCAALCYVANLSTSQGSSQPNLHTVPATAVAHCAKGQGGPARAAAGSSHTPTGSSHSLRPLAGHLTRQHTRGWRHVRPHKPRSGHVGSAACQLGGWGCALLWKCKVMHVPCGVCPHPTRYCPWCNTASASLM